MKYPYRVSLRRQRNNLTKTSTLIFTHEQLREKISIEQNKTKRNDSLVIAGKSETMKSKPS
jgi:hypothetical protein